jgi:hypothetical protein
VYLKKRMTRSKAKISAKRAPEVKDRATSDRQRDKATSEFVKKVFADIEKIRRRVKPLPKGMTVKDLIEEGRRY